MPSYVPEVKLTGITKSTGQKNPLNSIYVLPTLLSTGVNYPRLYTAAQAGNKILRLSTDRQMSILCMH